MITALGTIVIHILIFIVKLCCRCLSHGWEIMNFFFLSFYVVTFIHSDFGTVRHWLCHWLCHCTLLSLSSLSCYSHPQCGISGWVLQCCRPICKYIHHEAQHTHYLMPLPHLTVSSCSSSL